MNGTALRRREFLAGLGTAVLGGMIAAPARADFQNVCGTSARKFDPDPQVAVSLKKMCATVARRGGARFNPMGDLTRLDGIVVDRKNNDVVLWGAREDHGWRLMFDDFTVAVRAAHGEYAVEQNGRWVLYQPGISIDADNTMWGKLRAVENLAEPKNRQLYLDICASHPMRLRVDGMPRHTRVSDVLLAADYRMKLVNNGQVKLPIPNPPRGIFERSADRFKLQRQRGVQYARPDYDVNRWWFSAGEFSYQTASSTVAFLDKAQVVLNHQAEVIRNGEMVDAGVDAIDEAAFGCDWTDRMEETFQSEQLWCEMRNVFRHFAVARIIADNGVLNQAGFDAEVLLRTHQVERVPIPDTIQGAGLVAEQDIGGSPWFMPTCGGVTVNVADRLRRTPDEGATGEAGERVLFAARKSPDSVSWEVDV